MGFGKREGKGAAARQHALTQAWVCKATESASGLKMDKSKPQAAKHYTQESPSTGSVTRSTLLLTFWGMRGNQGNKTSWDTGWHWLSHPHIHSCCYWEYDRTKPILNKYVASHDESELCPVRDKGATCQILPKILLLLVLFTYSSQAADARPNGNYS